MLSCIIKLIENLFLGNMFPVVISVNGKEIVVRELANRNIYLVILHLIKSRESL